MKRHLFYLSMALVLALFSACGNGKKGVFTPTSSGRAYEILVVVDQGLWERPAGRALYDVLDSDVPGLPQSERSFRIMYTSPSNYDATLKLIRNIIIVEVNKDLYTQPKFKYAKNVYAALCHLQKDSVQVTVGQYVKAGDYVGNVGHSGNSFAPHLHFQLMDSRDITKANGLPCAFREYEIFIDGLWKEVKDGVPTNRDRIRF